jgi:hypothetical protein
MMNLRFPGEIAIGDIDGDALLTFGLQAVHQQRQIDFFIGGVVFLRIALDCGQLVFENQF